MAGIDLRLQTIRRALAAFGATPGRSGRFVRLTDCDEVLVGGDIHGHVENFRRLLQRADLARNHRRHLVVQELVHGPFQYPTGGDKSHQLVDLVCALKAQHPNQVHYLLGNHELAQLTRRMVLKNDADLNEVFEQGVHACYGQRGAEVYSLYEVLFRTIPVALRTSNRVFISHSLPSAGMLPEFDPVALCREPTRDIDVSPSGSIYALVWGRDVREETLNAFLKRVDADRLVSGHIPCEAGFGRPSGRKG